MLFIGLFKIKSATIEERIIHRVQWELPEGVKLIGEYWLFTNDPSVITIFKAENPVPLMAINAAWGDLFDVTIVPAVSAEEGFKLIESMGQG